MRIILRIIGWFLIISGIVCKQLFHAEAGESAFVIALGLVDLNLSNLGSEPGGGPNE